MSIVQAAANSSPVSNPYGPPIGNACDVTLAAPPTIGNIIVVGVQLIQSLGFDPGTFTVFDDFGFGEYAPLALPPGGGETFGGQGGNQDFAVVTAKVTSTIAPGPEIKIHIRSTVSADIRNIHAVVLECTGISDFPIAIGDGGNQMTQGDAGGIPANSEVIMFIAWQGIGSAVLSTSDTNLSLVAGNNANTGGVGGVGYGSLACFEGDYILADPSYNPTQSASADAPGFLTVVLIYAIGAPAPPPPPPPDIITDICLRAGLLSSQFDVSKVLVAANFPTLGNVVPGYLVERPTPAAQVAKVLMGAYFFDACESDGKIRWVPRGAAPVLVIPEGDLGLVTDRHKIIESQGQEQDLQKEITVLYNDPAIDYAQGKQSKSRNVRTIHTRNQEIRSIPITMTGTQARQIAEIALYTAWTERDSYAMNLWRAVYMMLDPTDVVQFVYEGITFTMRVVDNALGAGYVVSLNGVSEDARNYISNATGAIDAGFTPAPMILAALTTLFLFDIPLLTDTDSNPGGTGYYFAMSSLLATWPGALLYDSSDDVSFTSEATDNQPVVFGTATTVLAAPRSPWTWDFTNTLTISLALGALAGDTMLNVLNGSNMLLVGVEFVQFTAGVQNMDGTFTISGLLRGRRGTEWACGTHGAGELVVVISPVTVRRQALPLAIVNLLRYYRAVTIGQDLTTAGTLQFTITGNDLKPYAPADLAGTRDGSNNLSLTWMRRTRIGGEWLDGIEVVPLSEDSEAYQIDIFSGITVVRTIAVAGSPAASYSAAQQTADGLTPGNPVALKIYQMSGEVGRGIAAGATV